MTLDVGSHGKVICFRISSSRTTCAMEHSYEMSMMQEESGAETSRQRMRSISRWNPDQYSAAILAALGCAAESYAQYSLNHLRNDNEEHPVMSMEMYIGACAGSLLTLALMHVHGRKVAAAAIATIYVLYFLMLWILPSSDWLRVVTVIVGIGFGGIYTVMPTYLVEIAEVNSRGRMGAIMLMMTTFGYFMGVSLSLFSQKWIEHILSLVLGVLFLGASVWMPESPHFLIFTGRHDKAFLSLRRLRVDVVKAEQQLQVLEESTQEYERRYSTWCARFINREAMKAVAIAVGLMVLQIIGMPYMYYLFYLLNFEYELGILSAGSIVHLLQLVLTFVPLFLVDRVQRRQLLMMSAAGTAACYCLLAYMEYKGSFDNHLVLKILIHIILVISFNFGMGCLPWIISAELMPNGVRAIGCATVMFIYSISTYIYWKMMIYFTFSWTIHLFVYGCVTISCIIYVKYLLPETKGKVL